MSNPIERYTYVSHGQLSVARHYGGYKVNGSSYTYNPTTDELIRDDILKKSKKATPKASIKRAKTAKGKSK